VITKVNKSQMLAVFATAGHPAAQRDRLAHLIKAEFAA
jgi:hypothetical protein